MNPGTILGKKYKILRTIGYGGMATVYLAQHIETQQQYAIKVLDPKYYQDQNILQRFKREASIGKALHHKNIPIFHGFEFDKGLYYIVMEYVQGYNVRQYLKQYGVFSIKDAVFILNEVLQTLHFAYENGIQAHRDIKPENIMIDPATKTIKIMDFGVSRMEESTLTTETKIYTVKYASPEQLLPTRFPKGVTQQSDLYSLGIVFYEMITGKLPFEGTTQVDILEQELHFSITPPHEINSSIPAYISNTILKSLLPNPHHRYQTPEEMRQDLLSRNCQSPLPKNKSYGVQKRNNTMVYWLGGFLALALLLGGIFAWGYFKGKDYVNVVLDSNPPGAFVFVDGVQLEETLTPAKFSLQKSLHNITIVKNEYEKAGTNLDLSNEKQKTVSLSFDLEPTNTKESLVDGLLFVKSNPEAAKVYIDGVYIGDTPLENYGIPSGEHSLYVSKSGYYNSKPGTFIVNENLPGKELFKTSLHLLLTKIPPQQKSTSPSSAPPKQIYASLPATLEINSVPPGALVMINGDFVDTTPLIVQLPPENYSIRVDKMGYEAYMEDVQLDGNSNKTLNVSLVSKIGKPILVNPKNQSTNLKPPVEFTWEKSENASHYRVYITNLQTGYKVFGEKGQRVDANGFFVEAYHLSKGATYAWMVNAFKDESESEWCSSDQYEFSTEKEKKIVVSPTVRLFIVAYDKFGNRIDDEILCYINNSFIDTLDGLKSGYDVKRNTKYTIRIGSEENYYYEEKTINFSNQDASTQTINFTLLHR